MADENLLTYEKILELKDIMINDCLRALPKWVGYFYGKGLISDSVVLDLYNDMVISSW